MGKPEGSGVPDVMRDLTTEERAFLAELARTGVASRRIWKFIVFLAAGTASVCGAIAAAIGLAHMLGGAR